MTTENAQTQKKGITQRKFAASDSIMSVVTARPGLPIDELVQAVIADHEAEGCIFFEGAASRIIANYKALGNPKFEEYYDSPTMGLLCPMLNYEESFCPHEGVDKRDHAT